MACVSQRNGQPSSHRSHIVMLPSELHFLIGFNWITCWLVTQHRIMLSWTVSIKESLCTSRAGLVRLVNIVNFWQLHYTDMTVSCSDKVMGCTDWWRMSCKLLQQHSWKQSERRTRKSSHRNSVIILQHFTTVNVYLLLNTYTQII